MYGYKAEYAYPLKYKVSLFYKEEILKRFLLFFSLTNMARILMALLYTHPGNPVV